MYRRPCLRGAFSGGRPGRSIASPPSSVPVSMDKTGAVYDNVLNDHLAADRTDPTTLSKTLVLRPTYD